MIQIYLFSILLFLSLYLCVISCFDCLGSLITILQLFNHFWESNGNFLYVRSVPRQMTKSSYVDILCESKSNQVSPVAISICQSFSKPIICRLFCFKCYMCTTLHDQHPINRTKNVYTPFNYVWISFCRKACLRLTASNNQHKNLTDWTSDTVVFSTPVQDDDGHVKQFYIWDIQLDELELK